MKRVFVHADHVGARRANGGFLCLALLATELSNMGYEALVFDCLDRLAPHLFDWLSLGDLKFGIASFAHVRKSTAPIITGWLPALMDGEDLVSGIDVDRVRLWDGGIIRDGMKAERALANRMPRIWSVNEGLLGYFRTIGYEGDVIPLENWIRSDLFCPASEERVEGRVGYQSDGFVYSVEDALRERFGDRLLLCEGNQAEVAAKMQSCDYYISWNRQFNCFQEVGLVGETFNLSMFEAMACGCITISRYNSAFDSHCHYLSVRDTYVDPYLTQHDELDEAMQWIEQKDAWRPQARMQLRKEQSGFVESYFRFDEHRKAVLEEMLS